MKLTACADMLINFSVFECAKVYSLLGVWGRPSPTMDSDSTAGKLKKDFWGIFIDDWMNATVC